MTSVKFADWKDIPGLGLYADLKNGLIFGIENGTILYAEVGLESIPSIEKEIRDYSEKYWKASGEAIKEMGFIVGKAPQTLEYACFNDYPRD